MFLHISILTVLDMASIFFQNVMHFEVDFLLFADILNFDGIKLIKFGLIVCASGILFQRSFLTIRS